jgi:nitrite reductase/ring-hydroxylating ferredoxin subunit
MESSGIIEATCPHCSEKLLAKLSGKEAQADDRVFCPVHGDICSLEEAKMLIYEQNKDDLIKGLQRKIRDAWRKG